MLSCCTTKQQLQQLAGIQTPQHLAHWGPGALRLVLLLSFLCLCTCDQVAGAPVVLSEVVSALISLLAEVDCM